MDWNINDKKNIAGMGNLMGPDTESREILELEKKIISGADIDLDEEIEHDINEYKLELERIEQNYNVNDTNNQDNDSHGDNLYGSSSNNIFNSSGNDNSNDALFNFDKIEDDQLKYITIEQKKQSHVDNVLKDIEFADKDLEIDIDKESDEADKNMLLEQIDMIRDTLIDDGVQLNNVPKVTKENSISDIKNVYKILRTKNDRNRSCSFAEELILAGAQGIEYLFDGKKEWFGKKPDLVGWNNTVRIKLRRCRFDTSMLVKDIMQDYNMSPLFRLVLELIPSMFLYSRQKKSVMNENNNDNDYNEAISNLNNVIS